MIELRCKPGDLAMVTNNSLLWQSCPFCGERQHVIRNGVMVRVVRVVSDRGVWLLEEPVPFHVTFSCGLQLVGTVGGIVDRALTPIRPDLLDGDRDEPVEKPKEKPKGLLRRVADKILAEVFV